MNERVRLLMVLVGGVVLAVAPPAAAVHGVTAVAASSSSLPNSAYPAVGYLTTGASDTTHVCTATLIGPQVAITAAHCYGAVAQGCSSARQALAALPTFVLSQNGTGSDRAVYEIDGLAIHPKAYSPKLSECTSGSDHTCANEPWPRPFGLHESHDIALIHLKTAVPTSQATALQVITGTSNLVPAMLGNPPEPSGNGTGVRTTEIDEPFAQCQLFHPHVVGWGASDNGDGDRHAGDGEFGPEAFCNASVNQFGVGTLLPAQCTGSTTPINDPDPVMEVDRILVDVTYSGPSYATPAAAPRDDGAPVLAISTDPSQQPGLPVGAYVLGVVSIGDGTSDGNQLSSEEKGEALTAPTFTVSTTTKTWGATNGIWIEQRLKDFDDDGFDDDADNCPLASNADQQDTNAADEDVLGVAHVGDACDPNGTTSITTFDTTNGEEGPCRVCKIGGVGGCSVDPNTFCPEVLSSGLQLDSYIGNPTGDAASVNGTSNPVSCPCLEADSAGTDLATLLACENDFECTLANDGAFPPINGSPPVLPSSWQRITRQTLTMLNKIVIRSDAFYGAVPTLHQELSGVIPFTPMSVPTTWDFRADFPSLTSLPSLTWAHVLGPSTLVGVDLSNHYRADTFTIGPGTIYEWIAPFGGQWTPWWDHGDPWEQPWITVIQEGTQLLALSASATTGVSDVTSHFDTPALSLLAGVAARTSDLLVGDDMLPVMPFGSAARPALVVAAGSLDVQGALTRVGGHVGGVLPRSVIGTADPAVLRAYDAKDGFLWALHASPTGASLTQVDVALALASQPDTSTIVITGTPPQAPLAMAWHGIEQGIFVLDAASTTHGEKVLRLLRIDRAGVAGELWRTAPIQDLPDAAFLSATQQNELLLSIVHGDHTEAVLLEPDGGAPLASVTVNGRALGRVMATVSAVVFPISRKPHDEQSNLDLKPVARGEFTSGLCGTRWLRHRVDVTTTTALGTPQKTCQDGQ